MARLWMLLKNDLERSRAALRDIVGDEITLQPEGRVFAANYGLEVMVKAAFEWLLRGESLGPARFRHAEVFLLDDPAALIPRTEAELDTSPDKARRERHPRAHMRHECEVITDRIPHVPSARLRCSVQNRLRRSGCRGENDRA